MRRAPPAVTVTTLSGAPTVHSRRLCLPARATSTRIATSLTSPRSVVATAPERGRRRLETGGSHVGGSYRGVSDTCHMTRVSGAYDDTSHLTSVNEGVLGCDKGAGLTMSDDAC